MKRHLIALTLAVTTALGFGLHDVFAASYQQPVDTGYQYYNGRADAADYQFTFHFDKVSQTWVDGSDFFFVIGSTVDTGATQTGRYCGVHNGDGTCNTMVYWANVVFKDGYKEYPRFNCYPNGSWTWGQY